MTAPIIVFALVVLGVALVGASIDYCYELLSKAVYLELIRESSEARYKSWEAAARSRYQRMSEMEWSDR